MPSNASFDPFRRFRLRSTPVPTRPPSSEEDTDESSPERDRPRIIHVLAPRSVRKSGERLLSLPECGPPEKASLSGGTQVALSFGDPPLLGRPEGPPKLPPKSGVASDSTDALQPPTKSTLIRRVTSKLHITIPSKPSTQNLRSRPSTRTLPPQMGPRSPRATLAVSPTLPNGFTSREHREAALRERGLRPLRKDLSEQEREADERLGCASSPASVTGNGPSEAEQLKARWLAKNHASESTDFDSEPLASPHLQTMSIGPRSVQALRSSSAPDVTVVRRSSEGKADFASAGRPSMSSSVPPMSTSSHLEVLHEEPSEQGPITPLSPANVPIIVSSPLGSRPSSPILVESPVSCTFSSRYPGSTLESQSHSDHSRGPERESIRSSPFRRRTTDSGDRPRKAVGLSRMGSHSLTNLRRSVVGSLKLPSSTTLSSADHSSSVVQVPRTAISPTMHSIGSIIRETRDIADAESRRLSELAFLD